MTGPESSADQARWQRCVPVEQTSDISAQMTTYTFIRSIRRKEALSELKEEEEKKTAVETFANHARWTETKKVMQMPGCGTNMNQTNVFRLYLSKE